MIKRLPLWLGLLLIGTTGQRSETGVPSDTVRLAPATGVTIEYIAHACFRITSPGGTRVVIDPYASRVWLGYDFPDRVTTDAVLITHPHYDHDAGLRMGKPFPWTDDVPIYRDPGSYRVGDVSITGVRGKHADPYGKEFGQINTIWIVEVAGIRIAHLGDNGPLTAANVRAMGRVHILMMPIDAEYHILKAAEIRDIRDAVRPTIVIPMHYQLPSLETAPDKPDDLGPVDPWLEGQTGVRRLHRHLYVVDPEALPHEQVIWVFRHSPRVVTP